MDVSLAVDAAADSDIDIDTGDTERVFSNEQLEDALVRLEHMS